MVRPQSCCRIAFSLVIAAALLFTVFLRTAAMASPKAPQPGDKSFDSGWYTRIVGNEASPSRLIAVDKNEQALFLFERHSPLRLAGKYVCATGQNDGDKFVEGDLKTPEGVYFVIQRLDSGLNFEKYGYEAFTLNYPNPVDKLRKKTGYGIWIHGRGSPVTPKVTEGCVSLNNTDIAVLGKDLTPGTPVALAAGVSFSTDSTAEDTAVVNALYKRTRDWASAWASRSKNFFDYYDQEAYSLAQGESFTAFRQQKERIFKLVSYIDIKVSNVQALQGPGYWVTWFQQDYRASNLASKGVRRLYWQKDQKGELRIVGMEWAPHLFGTLTAGLNGAPVAADPTTVAKPEKTPEPVMVVAAVTPEVSPAPVAPVQAALAPAKPEPAPVVKAEPAAPQISAASPTVVEKPVVIALAEVAEKSPPPAKPQHESAKQSPKKTAPEDVSVFIENWRKAWEKGDLNAYAACYDKRAVQGKRAGASAIRSHKASLWKRSQPKQVELTNIRITSKQDTVVADMHQAYTDSKSYADMGIKTLHLEAKDNTWRIVREDWSPMQQ